MERVRPTNIVEEGIRPDLLLINTPATFQQGIIPDDEEPSFGMLRVAVAVYKKGFIPAYLDAHRSKLSLEQINSVLLNLQPKLVGINPTSVNIPEAQEIAELCAKKDIPVILGGVHSSLDPHTALKRNFPMARAAIKGRGEYATQHVISDMKNGRKTFEPGVFYQNSDASRTDFARNYSLDNLPLINQAMYVENPLTTKVVNIGNTPTILNEISLYETAGCPFQCSFCATPALTGRGKGQKPYHRPQMDRILKSTESALQLGANAVHFLDDMAFVKPDHFRSFAIGVNKMDTPNGFYWRGMTRAPIIADQCSDQDLETIASSGCWRIALGVESGNDRILKKIKKGITKDQVRRAVTRLKKAGIPQVKAFFIMGFPNESREELQDTYNFIMELKTLGLTDISIFQFKPYPGTLEWSRIERENPDVLKQLSYIRIADLRNGSIKSKKTAEGVWLPDNLQIAQVPSQYVKSLVIKTITDFYK